MRALLLWLLLVVWMAGLWAQGPPAAPKVPGALDSVSRRDSPSPPVAKPPPQDPMSAAREKQQAAAARQRQAVRKQAEGVGAWMNGSSVTNAESPPFVEATDSPPIASAKAGCDVLGEASIAQLIDGAAKAQNVPPKLLHAVMEQESRFQPCAVSPKGAKGLMQLMPDTAADLGVLDPFDPRENVEAGAKYLKMLLGKYKGDLQLTLGAYNAGPAAVDIVGAVPNFKETKDYVQSVMQKVGTIPLDLPSIPMPKPIGN